MSHTPVPGERVAGYDVSARLGTDYYAVFEYGLAALLAGLSPRAARGSPARIRSRGRE